MIRKADDPGDSLQIHPQVAELHAECERLRGELARLTSERDVLVHTGVPYLAAEYQLTIGQYQYELFCVQTRARRLERKIEIIQAALNRAEDVSLKAVEAALDDELAQWDEQARRKYAEIEEARQRLAHLMTPEECVELQRIYYDLVKKLHPDVNPDRPLQAHNIWLRVVEAYKCGDLKELKALSLLVETIPESPPPPSSLKKLRTFRERLADAIQRTLSAIAEVKKSFPFSMEKLLADPEWVRRKQEDYAKRIEKQEARLRDLEHLLAELEERLRHGK